MTATPAKKVKGKVDVDSPESGSVEDRFFRAVQGMEKRLETRLKALEDKFFAFQCGAQAQMERDRQAMAFERLADERPPAGPKEIGSVLEGPEGGKDQSPPGLSVLNEAADLPPQRPLAEGAGP